MKLLSVSDDDLKLLNALKPFLSPRGQEVLEIFSTVINVFRPSDPEQKINIEALSTLLSIVAEPSEKENNENEKDEIELANGSTKPEKSQELETLLNILAEKEKRA
ncbi:hypothetical protein [Thermosediminibacter litoriperuensis]|uniref:Uncharacterized protein n=1 Tax=Thermosediminibacter litoriperuensis TaxID=291989 RepID=A0A5S5AW75_9FIRM|nr:hypothetical protein [Thermosediminibacter litoriperuensis]TYP57601.1 hypothetical protein LZ11_00594 [Thermosediminibacter litoriperuensis]